MRFSLSGWCGALFSQASTDRQASGRFPRARCRCRLEVEELEARLVPSRVTGTASPTGFTPAQIEQAYGINQISFGGISGTGKGQTIALVDAYNDPTIASDLAAFDAQFPIAGPPSFKIFNQAGTDITSLASSNTTTSIVNGVPGVDPTTDWEREESLDVEWAHALAPQANIVVVESNTSSKVDYLQTAVPTAASLPGVSVVSMSYAIAEFSGETAYDQYFTTPPGHIPVTFVAATGDGGAPAEYPAASPNVVAVGGTTLVLNAQNNIMSETGWSFENPLSALVYNGKHYTQTGTWNTQTVGFNGSEGVAPTGGSSTATWSDALGSNVLGSRGTEISATWVADSGNATNATYSIYDGTAATGTLLATVTVNQQSAPVGTQSSGFSFQSLGVFRFTSGTATVVLSNGGANGNVVAGAIGFAPASASTGGISAYEGQPLYQTGVNLFRTNRSTPDVAFDANPSTGVPIYDSFNSTTLPWIKEGGTSYSAPAWAALFATYDQGRVHNGLQVLGTNQALLLLYSAPAADFNDITSGYNGFSAGTGYDLVTGRGSPIANLLAAEMLSSTSLFVLDFEFLIHEIVRFYGNLTSFGLSAQSNNGNSNNGNRGQLVLKTAASQSFEPSSANAAAVSDPASVLLTKWSIGG